MTSKMARCGWWSSWVKQALLVPYCDAGWTEWMLRDCRLNTRTSAGPRQCVTMWHDKTRRERSSFSKRWRRIGPFLRQKEEGWEKQALRNRHLDSNSAVWITSLACSPLDSSLAMLIVVMDAKTITQSMAMSSLRVVHGTSAGQGTWLQGKAWVRWANQRRYTQKAQHKCQNGWIFLILPRNYTKEKVIVEWSLWW